MSRAFFVLVAEEEVNSFPLEDPVITGHVNFNLEKFVRKCPRQYFVKWEESVQLGKERLF